MDSSNITARLSAHCYHVDGPLVLNPAKQFELWDKSNTSLSSSPMGSNGRIVFTTSRTVIPGTVRPMESGLQDTLIYL